MENRLSKLLKLPVWVCAISFTIGTLILLLNLFGDRDLQNFSMGIGFLYVLAAAFINASVFGALIICSFIFKERQNEIQQQAAVLFINIPVVILYIYIVFNDPFGLTKNY